MFGLCHVRLCNTGKDGRTRFDTFVDRDMPKGSKEKGAAAQKTAPESVQCYKCKGYGASILMLQSNPVALPLTPPRLCTSPLCLSLFCPLSPVPLASETVSYPTVLCLCLSPLSTILHRCITPVTLVWYCRPFRSAVHGQQR